jgi:hypothetical protein
MQFVGDDPSFANSFFFVDFVSDETDYFNVGQYSERSFAYTEMKPQQRSSWREYPNYYKFFSMHFKVSPDINYI